MSSHRSLPFTVPPSSKGPWAPCTAATHVYPLLGGRSMLLPPMLNAVPAAATAVGLLLGATSGT